MSSPNPGEFGYHGMLLKISYVGVVSYYWVATGVPGLFQPFVFIDAVMLVLFIIAYRVLSSNPAPLVQQGSTAPCVNLCHGIILQLRRSDGTFIH